jgi:outer membrane protein, heavy metal efflux system
VRREIILWASAIWLGWNAAPCRAQAGLSLRDAVTQALQSRASLKAEAERVSAAEGLRRQAGLFPNPEFQFQNENLRPGQTYSRDVDTLAMISQQLDVFGKRKPRIALAGEGVLRTQAEAELARWRVAQEVKLAYWAARGSQEIRDVLKRTAENFQRIVDFHAAQLSQGAIAEQDFLRVRLEGERLKISSDLAFIEANRARMELLKEMGRTDFSDMVLTEPLAINSPVAPLGVEEALAQRIEIRVARAAVEQAKANVKLQDVAARPDLNLLAGYKGRSCPIRRTV